MSQSIIIKISKLRLLVSFLGEKAQGGWWDTTFLSENGLSFLEFNFPRSPVMAGMTAAGQAAKRLHDSRIGKSGVYHLFRFPTGMEEEIHASLLEDRPDGWKELIADKEAALAALQELGGSGGKVPEGPIEVCKSGEIYNEGTLAKFADHYAVAFRADFQSFPYLKSEA